VTGSPPPSPDRYEPLPGLLELPAWLLRRLSRPARLALGLGATALAVVLVLVFADTRDDRRARAQADERERAAAAAERRARATAQARPQRGRGPRAAGLEGAPAMRTRRALVAQLEADVLADARARSRSGELRGAFRSAECARFPKGLERTPPQDDLRLRSARFECLAAIEVLEADAQTSGSSIGRPFRARVDFASGRYAWCLLVQRPGELSASTAPVQDVPRVCGGS